MPESQDAGRPEKSGSGAQRREAVLEFLSAHADSLGRQGYVVETWRMRGRRRCGPYYRLRYRDGHTQRSLYLGGSAELAEEVRERLRDLQQPRTERLRWDALLARQRVHGRRLKAALALELAKIGLKLKGFEIRGFRESPLGTSPRPVPPGESKQKEGRYLDVHEDDQLDEAQLADWVKEASQLPGERIVGG